MFKKTYSKMGALMVAGMVTGHASDAYAQAAKTGNADFGTITKNIIIGIQDVPGLLSALAYLFGILLGVLGVMKIKDHVENPTQTPLKDGAIRLAIGGALFALPLIFEAMLETTNNGNAANSAAAASLKKVNFAIN